jgi:hypothetical protein
VKEDEESCAFMNRIFASGFSLLLDSALFSSSNQGRKTIHERARKRDDYLHGEMLSVSQSSAHF